MVKVLPLQLDNLFTLVLFNEFPNFKYGQISFFYTFANSIFLGRMIQIFDFKHSYIILSFQQIAFDNFKT